MLNEELASWEVFAGGRIDEDEGVNRRVTMAIH